MPPQIVRTINTAPIAPESTTYLIKVNSSSIVLDLASWVDGGCPITSFVVEYQKIRAATTKSEMVSSENSKSDSSLSKEVTISVHEDHYTGQYL